MQTHRSVLLTLSLALWSPAALAADVTVTLPAGDGFATGSVRRLHQRGWRRGD